MNSGMLTFFRRLLF